MPTTGMKSRAILATAGLLVGTACGSSGDPLAVPPRNDDAATEAGAARDAGADRDIPDAGELPDAVVPPEAPGVVAEGDWAVIDEALVQRLTAAGQLPPKDSSAALKYTFFGPTAGVGCDPFTGDVYLGLAGAGVWVSTDDGDTFSPFAQTAISGEYAGFLNADLDTPGRLAFFGADDDSLLTTDRGKTWTRLTRPLFSRGWNFGAVDWTNAIPATVLVLEHGGSANRFVSTNGGQSFAMMRAGDDVHSGAGTFDARTLVTSDADGLWRTADAGASWVKVSDRPSYGSLMVLRRGIGYFATERGLIMSTDLGETWTQLGDTSHAFERGPWFESDETLVAADASGFYRSTDRAKHWSFVSGWPAGFYDPKKPAMELGNHSSACWDSIHHRAYVSDFKNIHKTDATVGTFTGHTFRRRFR